MLSQAKTVEYVNIKIYNLLHGYNPPPYPGQEKNMDPTRIKNDDSLVYPPST